MTAKNNCAFNNLCFLQWQRGDEKAFVLIETARCAFG